LKDILWNWQSHASLKTQRKFKIKILELFQMTPFFTSFQICYQICYQNRCQVKGSLDIEKKSYHSLLKGASMNLNTRLFKEMRKKKKIEILELFKSKLYHSLQKKNIYFNISFSPSVLFCHFITIDRKNVLSLPRSKLTFTSRTKKRIALPPTGSDLNLPLTGRGDRPFAYTILKKTISLCSMLLGLPPPPMWFDALWSKSYYIWDRNKFSTFPCPFAGVRAVEEPWFSEWAVQTMEVNYPKTLPLCLFKWYTGLVASSSCRIDENFNNVTCSAEAQISSDIRVWQTVDRRWRTPTKQRRATVGQVWTTFC
jgi:hypothetical protein